MGGLLEVANNMAGGNKTIKTAYLTIEGNLLKWAGTIIQLSNVSLVSTANVAEKPFPIISVLIGLVAIGLIWIGKFAIVFGIVTTISAAYWIYSWREDNHELRQMQKLNILLNSGLTYTIVFYDRKFLAEVMRCFEKILRDQTHDEKYVINIKDNVITGGATVIDQVNTY